MRDSKISFDQENADNPDEPFTLEEELANFKRKFPDACWSISEPVVEKWRKKANAPFSIFLTNDDRIGEAGHFFAMVETSSIFEGTVEAIRQVEEKYDAWVESKKRR